ncbi:hypothetical protein PBY51_019856 [Eleginops maclovinus]|nr:hypothetical protein PBY51_019856 [Eleginops maclovinus]
MLLSFLASYLPWSGLLAPLPVVAAPWITDAAPCSLLGSAHTGLLHYPAVPLAFEGALLPEAPHILTSSQPQYPASCLPSPLIQSKSPVISTSIALKLCPHVK